jgi:hypothetical protein
MNINYVGLQLYKHTIRNIKCLLLANFRDNFFLFIYYLFYYLFKIEEI